MARANDQPRWRRLGLLVAALALALAPSLASAQPRGSDAGDEQARARAKALLDQGDEHLRRGDAMSERGRSERAIAAYERALESYESAFDAFPEARIYYPIARAEEQLGRYLDAYQHYQLVLDEVEELSDRLRAEVETRQEAVRSRVAAIHVAVEPPEARLAIDGEEAGQGPFEDPIYVAAGKHTVEISAEQHGPRVVEIDAREGGSVQLVVALQPARGVTPTRSNSPTFPSTTSRGARPPSRAPLAAGISITAGLGAAATVTGLLAVSKHGVFSDLARPSDERQAARDSGQIFAVATDVLLVATAAAAGYTAYYYYGIYRGRKSAERRASEAQAWWIAPYAGERRGGVAVGGRF